MKNIYDYAITYPVFSCLIILLLFPFISLHAQENSQKFNYIFSRSKDKPDTVIKIITPDSSYLFDFYDMSLDDLDSLKATGLEGEELEEFLNAYIAVSTKKSISTKENPAIVTLITSEEIKNSGARDLLEVLRLVPGFHFAQDEESVIILKQQINAIADNAIQ